MGISFSNRRRNNHYPQHPPPPYYYSSDASSLPPPPPLLPPPLPPPPPPPQNYAGYATNSSYPTPRPPPPPSIHSSSYGPYSSCSYANPSTAGRFNYHYHYHQHPPYFAGQPNGWVGAMMRPPMVSGPPQQTPPPPYVEHQNAKKVRNDVNVHKGTVQLEADEQNPDHHLVSFVFDALFDGSFTISYFAKEESNCKFVPQFPDVYTPVRIPFQKGLGQRFLQTSGTGIDLGFFELDDLSKPSAGDVFPLVISAETCSSSHSADDNTSEAVSNESVHMQITQAILEKTNGDPFKVKVIRQILWIDGVRYELRELFGIGSSALTAESFDDSEPGKECVICMTEPKDTAVMPCRHLCMCSECAKALRVQSNKCPICRQPIEELIEIKINNNDE